MKELINKVQKIEETNFKEYCALNGDPAWSNIKIQLPFEKSYTIYKELKITGVGKNLKETMQYILYYNANNHMANGDKIFKFKSLDNLKKSLISKLSYKK